MAQIEDAGDLRQVPEPPSRQFDAADTPLAHRLVKRGLRHAEDGERLRFLFLQRVPVLAALVILALAAVRCAPDRAEPEWQWISRGAAAATALRILGSIAFTIHVSKVGSYDKTRGSLGAVIMLLLWFDLTACVILAGAELNAQIERQTTPQAGDPARDSRDSDGSALTVIAAAAAPEPATAGHDLRPPLHTLSLLRGILAKRVKDQSGSRLIAKFEETLSAMSGMLNRLFDINRLEAGIVRPQIAEFPIGTVRERAFERTRDSARLSAWSWRRRTARLRGVEVDLPGARPWWEIP